MQQYNSRDEIPAKYKWDLSVIYADDAAFSADFDKAEKMIAAFPAHEKTMSSCADALLSMLKDYCAIDLLINRLYEYAARSFDVDTSVNANQARVGKVMDLANRAGSASYFVTPSLLRLDGNTLEKWYAECPELAAYRRLIDKEMRFKPYTLSDECEKVMADMGQCLGTASDVRDIISDSDIRFGKIKDETGKSVELTDTNYVPFMMNKDRRVRRAAFNTLYKTYNQFGNTYATLMNGFVKERVTDAKIRHFENSLTASVFHDEVTPSIYNNLIDTVSNNLDALFEYYDIKKEVLGVSSLHMYDIYPPLLGDLDREYSIEEGIRETLDMAKIYGDEYHDTLEGGLTKKGWLDVFPNRGKRGGAYSSGCYGMEPYILLNFKGTFDDVFTLAHECGHSMHSYFSRTYNKPHESDYTIFVAEVASTVNELLLANKKLRESQSDDEKLYVLNQLMDTYKGTLFRQTMFAEFEKEMHALVEKGEILTADLLNKTYYGLVKKYFGPRVVCDEPIAREWMRIPHFYYNFYVYKYSTCISVAATVVKKMETEGPAYVKKYIEFLKCGGSKSPLDSLKVADIDLTKPEVIEDAIESFRSAVRQFKELYAQKTNKN